MGWLYVIVIILSFIGIIIIASKSEKLEFIGILLLFLSGMVAGITTVLEPDSPAALDVYRGNTKLVTIETVRDTVVIKRDTFVVWKDKVKE